MSELDYSALGALNLPEIKAVGDDNKIIPANTEKPKSKPEPINEENIKEFAPIIEIDSIDDLDEVIDATEITKNKDKFRKNEKENVSDDDYDDNIDDNSSDPYEAYGTWLKEKSILDFDEEEFKKAKDKDAFLFEKEKEKIESIIQEYKESHSPYIKALMDMEEDGIDISKVLQHDAKIQSYEKVSIEKIKEDEALQKSIVKDYLRRQGNTESEIEEEIAEMEDNLTLDKKAEKWFPKLRDAEIKEKNAYIKAQEAEIKRQQKAYEDSLKETKGYIDKLDSLLPNVPLTKTEKEQIFENMTKADRTGQTQLMKAAQKDPIRFNAMVTYLATVKNWNFDDLVNATKTNVTKNIKEKLNPNRKDNPKTSVDLNVFKKVLKRK